MGVGLPLVSSRVVVNALVRAGYVERTTKSSHHVMVREDPSRTITVPERREVPRGTLRSILNQAGLSEERFRELAGL